MEKQTFGFKIKSLDDSGSFVGLAASYNNVDLGGDKILPGAFARTIAAGKSFPLLWQHDPSQPIGTVKVADSPQGLQVAGQLLLADPTARKCYEFLKAGVIRGLSIGYDAVKDSVSDGVRQLQELRLWEVSVVTFPMNEAAGVTAVKALSDADRASHLRAIDGHRKAIDRHQRAIRRELKSMTDDLDSDPLDEPDDPSLLESGDIYDDPPDEGMSMAVGELKALADLARELATA